MSTRLPKTSNPASRALEQASVTTLDEVATWTEKDLLALHGVGPKAIRIIGDALAERGMSFRSD